jgi:hypothetical protein
MGLPPRFALTGRDAIYLSTVKNAAFVFVIIFGFLLPAQALALQAVVLPPSVKPGDPFVLRVYTNPDAPEARVGEEDLAFAPCGPGCFEAVGAVDLQTPPGTVSIEVRAAGEVLRLPLVVEKAAFPLQKLTLPEGEVTLSPKDEARAEREAALLRALWQRVSGKLWEGRFLMPLDNSFSTAFGTRRLMNGTKKGRHTGLDIRGHRGEPVLAANAGRVVLARELFFGGNTVVLDHGQGIYTIYMHLSAFKVAKGSVVRKGQVIGLVGSTGRSTGPHLHYGVKVNAVNTNPVALSELPLGPPEGPATQAGAVP